MVRPARMFTLPLAISSRGVLLAGGFRTVRAGPTGRGQADPDMLRVARVIWCASRVWGVSFRSSPAAFSGSSCT